MNKPILKNIIKYSIVLISILNVPIGLKAQEITISNSIGTNYLYNKNNSIGPNVGISVSIPLVKHFDLGIGYQFASNSFSPNSEQIVLDDELDKISQYVHHEISLFATVSLITIKKYQLLFSPGLLVNSFTDGYVINEYFIDSESGFKAYPSYFEKGINYGAGVSIINQINMSEELSVSFITGINMYKKNIFNTISGEIVLRYKLHKPKIQ